MVKSEYLRSNQVCQILDLSPATLCRWDDLGILKTLQLRKRMRKKFLKSEVLEIQARIDGEA